MGTQGFLLLATADPLLEAELNDVPGMQVRAAGCETPAELTAALAGVAPDAVILSPAIAPWPGGLNALVQELRSRHSQLRVAILTEDQSDVINGASVLPAQGQPRTALIAWLRGEAPALRSQPSAAAYESSPPPATAPIVARATYAATPMEAPPQAQDRRLVPSRQAPPPAPLQPAGWTPAPQQVLRQKVVAVWGGKGGSGRSTLLAGLAEVISRIPGVRVCTVDFNPFSSSLSTQLRKESERNSWWTLSEGLLAAGTLTAQAVRDALIPVQSQWSLLTGPAGSDEWAGLLTPQTVSDLLDLLRAEFDYILIDLPAGRSPAGDAALAQAQAVLVVVSSFFPDVVDTARALDRTVADGILTRERCRLVLSQWVESAELPATDVGECLQLPVSAVLPLASAAALQAARVGKTVTQLATPEARNLAESIAAVAGLIAEGAVARPQKRGWFGK